jgi:hypothetical protein
MMRTSIRLVFVGACLVAPAGGEEPRPVISIRAVHPDRQIREVIELFEGAKAPHPAAALAAWKRASREPNRLGKPLEALITTFNPRMADELRALDGAEVSLWFEPREGRLAWGVSLPGDDGTFGALASAMVLSGGRSESRPGEPLADRLGGPGSPIMTRGLWGPLIAGSFEDLRVVHDRAEVVAKELKDDVDGLGVEVGRGALDGSRSIPIQRIAEVLRSTTKSIVGQFDIQDEKATAILGLSVPNPVDQTVIDPAWLDWVPSGRLVAGFAVAIPPGAAALDAGFGLVDRVERIDAARGNVAPLRLRLDLLARAFGVRTEADLFPFLEGVSGWVGCGEGKRIDTGLIALHFLDEVAARQFADRVKPTPTPGANGPRKIGQIDGRPVSLVRVDRSVAIAWGEASMASSMAARDDPRRSIGPALRAYWARGAPTFTGGIWPARVPGLIPESTPLSEALNQAAPIIISGLWTDANLFDILVLWDDLDVPVKRFLELIPMDPPPDR